MQYTSRGRLVRKVVSYAEEEPVMGKQEKTSIGKTMLLLPQSRLEEFAIRFCREGGESRKGKAVCFDFDLLRMKEPVLQ